MTAGSKRRTAIIVGAAGQDGTYLSRLLESEGMRVAKVTRSAVALDAIEFPAVDLRSSREVEELIKRVSPDEVYYLAAYHHSTQESAGVLPELFEKSFEVHCTGYRHVLEAVATQCPSARVFYASSALVFGYPDEFPQTEKTPMNPECVYGVTKAAGMGIGRVYRAERGVFVSSGILFNHESPLRRPAFVTRKIAAAAAEIARGRRDSVQLGSLSARVDWGAAEDYVRAMTLMLRVPEAGDYVVATGALHTVGEFASLAFASVGLDARKYIVEAPGLVQRRARTTPLCGDASKLEAATGWRPEISFHALVDRMVKAEMEGGSRYSAA